MSLTPKSIELMSNYFIGKISGGTVNFYAGGSKRPTSVAHPLVRGMVRVLSFNLGQPAGILDLTGNGKIQIQLAQQTYSYDNYSVPDFFRIYTSTGQAVYQGRAFAHGRSNPGRGGEVLLESKMADDIYLTTDAGLVVDLNTRNTPLPPNYKCTLTNITIGLY